jgi:hypothetical protein
MNIPQENLDVVKDVIDTIKYIESGDHFTFSEGFYTTVIKRDLAVKLATGNLVNSFPSVGFYGNNLLRKGDQYAMTMSINAGIPAWKNARLFDRFSLLFNYRF